MLESLLLEQQEGANYDRVHNWQSESPGTRHARSRQIEGGNGNILEESRKAKKGAVKIKHGKKPNVRQCKLMEEWGLNPKDWLVVKDTPDEMVLVHRYSDKTTRTITKG